MANRLEGKRVAFLAAGRRRRRITLVEEICEGRHDEQALQTAGSGG
jgi:hypothetical protein